MGLLKAYLKTEFPISLKKAKRPNNQRGRPDILLVNPPFGVDDHFNFPLGLLYIAATLRDKGYSVKIYDGTFDCDLHRFESIILELQPYAVGITAFITSRLSSLSIAKIAKNHGCIVILGGPDPTAEPSEYLYAKNSTGNFIVDYTVYGEGEMTMLELIDFLDPSANFHTNNKPTLQGLYYRGESGSLVCTGVRSYIQDLDSLPFPAHDLVDMGKYRKEWKRIHGYWMPQVMASRGCPYSCTWCQKSVFRRSFRIRSANSVALEMKKLRDLYGADRISLHDETLGVNKEWIRQFRDAVFQNDALIPFDCFSRVDVIDESMVSCLKSIGCRQIRFGIESGSQKVLNAMNKGTNIDQVYSAARICYEYDIESYYFMMVGYPEEDLNDLMLSIKLLVETVPDEFSTGIAYPLVGTEFYEKVKHKLKPKRNLPRVNENTLIFENNQYSTFIYQMFQKLFRAEWELSRHRKDRKRLHLLRYWEIIVKIHLLRLSIRIWSGWQGKNWPKEISQDINP